MKRHAVKEKKTYSFSRYILVIMILLTGLEFTGLTAFFLYSTSVLRTQRFTGIRQTLSLYDEELAEDLRSVNYYIIEISSNSSEFSQLALLTDAQDGFTAVSRVHSLLEYNFRTADVVEGMFTYFPRSDTWISVQNYGGKRQVFHNYLREEFRNGEVRDRLSARIGQQWNLYEHDGTTYLIRVYDKSGSYAGAWTNLDRLGEDLTGFEEIHASVFFADTEGNLLQMESASVLDDASEQEMTRLAEALDTAKSRDTWQIVRIAGTRYFLADETLSATNNEIRAAVLIPLREIDMSFRRYLQGVTVILGVTLLSFLLVDRILRRAFSGTVTMMNSVTQAITEGDEDRHVSLEGVNIAEMQAVGASINHMVNRMQELKIESYEKDIRARNFQLLALRSQVAPHFLINCLNMIGFMADGTADNSEIIHRMVATLSQHLRYTLSTRERVPLFMEAEHEKNYVELSRLRFPGCISFEMEISEEASRATVFPLILIMFTENTFKYNLVMGEELRLIVRAYLYENEGETRLHIEHIDSGSGFDSAVLERAAEDVPAEDMSADGAHIGIRNIRERLKLYYGGNVHFNLSNEPGMGARIDIDIPYVEYEEENQAGDQS